MVARGVLSRDELQDAREAYETSHQALQEISELFPFFGHQSDHVKDEGRIKKAVELLYHVRDAEERALHTFEEIIASEVVVG